MPLPIAPTCWAFPAESTTSPTNNTSLNTGSVGPQSPGGSWQGSSPHYSQPLPHLAMHVIQFYSGNGWSTCTHLPLLAFGTGDCANMKGGLGVRFLPLPDTRHIIFRTRNQKVCTFGCSLTTATHGILLRWAERGDGSSLPNLSAVTVS